MTIGLFAPLSDCRIVSVSLPKAVLKASCYASEESVARLQARIAISIVEHNIWVAYNDDRRAVYNNDDKEKIMKDISLA